MNDSEQEKHRAFGAVDWGSDKHSVIVGLPLAAKTRNRHRGYASQIFKMAVDYGYTPINPVTKIDKFNERVTEENGEIAILSAAETEALFRTAWIPACLLR